MPPKDALSGLGQFAEFGNGSREWENEIVDGVKISRIVAYLEMTAEKDGLSRADIEKGLRQIDVTLVSIFDKLQEIVGKWNKQKATKYGEDLKVRAMRVKAKLLERQQQLPQESSQTQEQNNVEKKDAVSSVENTSIGKEIVMKYVLSDLEKELGKDVNGETRKFTEIVGEKPLDEMTEEEHERDRKFIDEFQEAILKRLLDKIIIGNTAGRGTVYPDPVESKFFSEPLLSIKLLDEPEKKYTLGDIFLNFPSRFSQVTSNSEGVLGWRIVSMEKSMNNAAHPGLKTGSYDEIWGNFGIYSDSIKGVLEGTAYIADFLMEGQRLKHVDPNERKFFPERETRYVLPVLTDYFMDMLSREKDIAVNYARAKGKYPPDYPFPLKTSEDLLRVKKEKFEERLNEMVGDKKKEIGESYFQAQMKIAWAIACWNFRSSLKESEADVLSNSGNKVGRIMSELWLKIKAKPGSADTPERGRPHAAVQFHDTIPNFERFERAQVLIPENEIVEIPYSQLPEDSKNVKTAGIKNKIREIYHFADNVSDDVVKRKITIIALKKPDNPQTIEDCVREYKNPDGTINDSGVVILHHGLGQRVRKITKSNGERVWSFSLNLEEIRKLHVKYEDVMWGAMTAEGFKKFGELGGFIKRIHYSGGSNLKELNGVFTSLFSKHLQEKINILPPTSKTVDKTAMTVRRLLVNPSIPKSVQKYSEGLLNRFLVAKVSEDDLALAEAKDGASGMKTGEQIKDFGKYLFNAILQSAATKVHYNETTGKMEKATSTDEAGREENALLILDMFRGATTDVPGLENANVLPRAMRRIVEDVADGKHRKRAEREFTIEMFLNALDRYLDQYDLKEEEHRDDEGKIIHEETSWGLLQKFDFEKTKKRVARIETISGDKPLTFAEKEILRQYIYAQLRYLYISWVKEDGGDFGELGKLANKENLPRNLAKMGNNVAYCVMDEEAGTGFYPIDIVDLMYKDHKQYGPEQVLLDTVKAEELYGDKKKDAK